MTKMLGDNGAETAVLAGLFAYGLESYVEISDIIDHNSFCHQNNQLIYKCIEKNTPDRLEMPFEIKRKEETNGRSKETTSC